MTTLSADDLARDLSASAANDKLPHIRAKATMMHGVWWWQDYRLERDGNGWKETPVGTPRRIKQENGE